MNARPVVMVLLFGCVAQFHDRVGEDSDVPPTDSAPTDETVLETDPAPLHTDQAPADSDPPEPGCLARLHVDVAGSPLPALPLLAHLEAFEGLADDLSNLRVRHPSGDLLPHWVESAEAGSGTAWIAAPGLPLGRTTLALDACDDSPSEQDAPGDLFPLHVAFDQGLAKFGWCTGCTASLGDDDGDAHARVTVPNDCGADFRGYFSRGVRLGVGRYEVSYRTRVLGTRTDTCTTPTRADLEVAVDGAVLDELGCAKAACGTCATDWTPTTTTFTVTDSSYDTDLRFWITAGPCTTAELRLDDLRIRPVAQNPPTVTFEAP